MARRPHSDAAETDNTGRSHLVPTIRFKEEVEDECHDMNLHGALFKLLVDSGSAKRRHDRRLRTFWRHENLSMKMALATATHHSYDNRNVK